jgi:hypothetical protein
MEREDVGGVLTHLARCGLLYIDGPPPLEEKSVMLVWRGGCHAVPAYRDRDGALREYWGDEPIYEKEVYCWMRMPHPRYWPCVGEQPVVGAERLMDGEHRTVFDMTA